MTLHVELGFRAHGVRELDAACEGGTGLACVRSLRFGAFERVTAYAERARAACEHGDTPTCLELAERADGAERAALLALVSDMGEPLCGLDDAGRCFDVGVARVLADRPLEALPLFTKACDLGLAMGCTEEGRHALETDPKRGLAKLGVGCTKGNDVGCDLLKETLWDPDRARLHAGARRELATACRAKRQAACDTRPPPGL